MKKLFRYSTQQTLIDFNPADFIQFLQRKRISPQQFSSLIKEVKDNINNLENTNLTKLITLFAEYIANKIDMIIAQYISNELSGQKGLDILKQYINNSLLSYAYVPDPYSILNTADLFLLKKVNEDFYQQIEVEATNILEINLQQFIYYVQLPKNVITYIKNNVPELDIKRILLSNQLIYIPKAIQQSFQKIFTEWSNQTKDINQIPFPWTIDDLFIMLKFSLGMNLNVGVAMKALKEKNTQGQMAVKKWFTNFLKLLDAEGNINNDALERIIQNLMQNKNTRNTYLRKAILLTPHWKELLAKAYIDLANFKYPDSWETTEVSDILIDNKKNDKEKEPAESFPWAYRLSAINNLESFQEVFKIAILDLKLNNEKKKEILKARETLLLFYQAKQAQFENYLSTVLATFFPDESRRKGLASFREQFIKEEMLGDWLKQDLSWRKNIISNDAVELQEQILNNYNHISEEFKWYGLYNLALIQLRSIDAEDVKSFVKNFENVHPDVDDKTALKQLLTTFLILDTHLDYHNLNVRVYSMGTENTAGYYSPEKQTINIGDIGKAHSLPDLASSIPHEIAHYLDHKWAKFQKNPDFPGNAWFLTDLPLPTFKETFDEWYSHIPQNIKKQFFANEAEARWTYSLLELIRKIKPYIKMTNNLNNNLDSKQFNEYLSNNHEIFARFVETFVKYMYELAMKGKKYIDKNLVSSMSAGEEFPQELYVEFIKLLQTRSIIDRKLSAQSKETYITKSAVTIKEIEDIAKNSTDYVDFYYKLSNEQQQFLTDFLKQQNKKLKDYWNEITNFGENLNISEWAEDYPSLDLSKYNFDNLYVPEVVRVVVDKNLKGEARAFPAEIYVSPKIFELAPDTIQEIIYHEFGHILSLNNKEIKRLILENPDGIFGKYNVKKNYFDGVFGGFNSEEAWANSFMMYHINKNALKEKYPQLFQVVDEITKKLSPYYIKVIKNIYQQLMTLRFEASEK